MPISPGRRKNISVANKDAGVPRDRIDLATALRPAQRAHHADALSRVAIALQDRPPDPPVSLDAVYSAGFYGFSVAHYRVY